MPLDVEAVRREFWRLDRSGGALRTDRVTTREDIHARWHWRTEQGLLRLGRDPSDEVGRNSPLISGKGTVKPKEEVNPLEKRFRYDPMPLPWFDNPPARAVFREPDPEHDLLSLLAGKHLAGYSGRPSGAEVFRWLTEGTQTELQQAYLAELLCDIREEMYPQLRRQDALSIWHIARAALECEIRRGALSWWLNQFASMPEGWRPEVPGEVPREAA